MTLYSDTPGGRFVEALLRNPHLYREAIHPRFRGEVEALFDEHLKVYLDAEVRSSIPCARCGGGVSIPCARCGGGVVEFSVPNDLWNQVIRPDGRDRIDEHMCLGCWHSAVLDRLSSLRARQDPRDLRSDL